MPTLLGLTVYWIAQAINFGLSLMFPFGPIFSLPLALVGLSQNTCALARIIEPAEIPGTAYQESRQTLYLVVTAQKRPGHLLQETCSPVVAGGSRNVCIDFLDMINQHKSMHNIS